MSFSQSEIKEHIRVFLAFHGILSLAVSQDDQPWISTGYYGMDEQMQLYVVTDPQSEHGKIYVANSHVAFAVFDSHQKITEPKYGVQGKGIIELIQDVPGMTMALECWHKANPGVEEHITVAMMQDDANGTKIYKITPTYLKFFNKELYGEEEWGTITLK